MSQKSEVTFYRKVKDETIYIRVEKMRRTVVELDFDGKGYCIIEWAHNCSPLDSRLECEAVSKEEFTWAILKALDAKEKSTDAC